MRSFDSGPKVYEHDKGGFVSNEDVRVYVKQEEFWD